VASVIPRKFADVSIESLANDGVDSTALGVVRDFVGDLDSRLERGRGLWFRGDVGTFKTALAMLVSKSAIEAGRSVAIYFLPKLLAEIRATYDTAPGGESYVGFFKRLTSVDLLHIDDLGAEKRTDWVLEQLYAIVNERYENERSLLVTTNLSEVELEEQIGPRIVSRIVEMCGDPIILEGQDRRYLRAVGSG
jgi:DNA replication protein DnaC